MYKKLNNLGFIIGIFFLIISLVLIVDGATSGAISNKLNLYTGFTFLAFGIIMILFSKNSNEEKKL